MKKKLLALICALALVFSLVGCTISAPVAHFQDMIVEVKQEEDSLP